MSSRKNQKGYVLGIAFVTVAVCMAMFFVFSLTRLLMFSTLEVRQEEPQAVVDVGPIDPDAPGFVKITQADGTVLQYYNIPCGNRFIGWEENYRSILTRPFRAGEEPQEFDIRDKENPAVIAMRVREHPCK